MTCTRHNAAPIKVICLGLGQTGTSSLHDALEMLGFGPCYHWTTIMQRDGQDFSTSSKVGDGNGRPEEFDSLFQGYSSITDYPAAMYGAELYSAYPDAKFVLTVRNPEEWEKSMNSTILQVEHMKHKNSLQATIAKWSKFLCEGKYHRGRSYTHTQQEVLHHNERVKQIIPSEKLLTYNVAEGWDRLVQFLNVPQPETPFPHVTDTTQYQRTFFPMYVEIKGEISNVTQHRVTRRENSTITLENMCWGLYI